MNRFPPVKIINSSGFTLGDLAAAIGLTKPDEDTAPDEEEERFDDLAEEAARDLKRSFSRLRR